MPVDVLQDHDGVVHHDPDRERETQKREGVEGEAEEVDGRERADDRGRDRQEDVEGGREGSQEEPADQPGEKDREDQRELDLVDGLFHRLRPVEDHGQAQVLGEGLPDLLQLDLDRLTHAHRVGTALLPNPHPLGGEAHGPGDPALVFQPVLDHRHVAKEELRVAPVAHDDGAEIGDGGGLPLGPDVHLPVGRLDPPRRNFHVLALERVHDVRDGEAESLQPRRVEPDPDAPLPVAAQDDVADARDLLEPVLETVPDHVGQLLRGPVARKGQPHDRLILGVGLGDDGWVNFPGKIPLSLGDLGLHVLEGGVDVPAQLELDGDVGLSLTAGGGDFLDSLHRRHRVLDDVGDVALHHLRRRPFQRHADVHDGKVDVGHLADAEAHEPESPEDDQGGHEHPGENRIPDGEIREGHFPLPPVSAWTRDPSERTLAPRITTRSPGRRPSRTSTSPSFV